MDVDQQRDAIAVADIPQSQFDGFVIRPVKAAQSLFDVMCVEWTQPDVAALRQPAGDQAQSLASALVV